MSVDQARTERRVPRGRGLTIVMTGYVISAVLLWAGVSKLASMSGDPPDFSPTPDEVATWSTGIALQRIGMLALLLGNILVVLLRRRLGFSVLMTVASVIGSVGGSLAIAAVVWMVSLPSVASG